MTHTRHTPTGLLFLLLIAAGGCGANQAGGGDTDATTAAFVPSQTSQSSPGNAGNDDLGHVTLLQWPEQVGDRAAANHLVGVFAVATRGIVNLANCVGETEHQYCVEGWPEADGSWVETTPFTEDLLDDIPTRSVGDRIALGDWIAEERRSPDYDFAYYYGDLGAVGAPPSSVGLRLNEGDWGEYEGTEDVGMPTPMVVQQPLPSAYHYFFSANPVQMRWEPGDKGDVYLAVLPDVTEGRLYRLEDSGEFNLDLTAMGLMDYEAVRLGLGRWSTETLDIDGNELTLQIQSDQWLHGVHRDVGGRTELMPADNCKEALEQPPLQEGSYWGDLTGFHNTVNPGVTGCTGFGAGGNEGILRVVAHPGQFYEFLYDLPNGDGAIYLLEDCRFTNTCVAGADSVAGSGAESLTWFNETDEAQELFLVLDAYTGPGGGVTDLMELDVTITDLSANVLYPSCVEAMEADAILPGTYFGDLAGYEDRLDPAESDKGMCSTPAPGGEGLVKVSLDADQTLEATVTMPGSNPVVYVVYACNFVDSCAAESASGGAEQTVVYKNQSGFSEYVYLVVDSTGGSGEYYLSVTFQ